MLTSVFRKVFGTANDRVLKKVQPMIAVINEFEGHVSHLSDEQLKGQTDLFKKRLADGESLENLLPEAFATVREAAKRVMGHRHFDVQLMGGLVLHRGMIAEMKTGEGKTLVATAPVYLNALTGRGVHVVTVNDYLAKRDAEWMGKIYNFLGLTVGSIVHGMNDDQRREAYAADITYGTNNEFGFDYLRDNMKFRLEEMCQRELHYAIVDEVDNILIDEARTPLIISGPSDDSSDLYVKVDRVIPKLEAGKHYEKDEKANNVTLTEDGTRYVEELVRNAGLLKGETLYDLNNVSVVHHINQALKAHTIFQKDKDYIINDGEIIIIDEFTGRMAEGRRYSDGLHQAIEAKEGVEIQVENQTLASITYQNYFRLYSKLAGMTGTAETDATEFAEIYKLDVVVLPTNKPLVRKDLDDEVYRTNQEKYEAIFKLIDECRSRNQPILVGTTSIEKSEMLSNMLKEKKIPHSVLNARYHEQEAEIIAEAGVPGAITIATNMAGRGTDIKLGGNVEARVAKELANIENEDKRADAIRQIELEISQSAELVRNSGGLYIIGTERHESRRIDNQLRGRAGRQGDPGMSKFFLSLEDDLMRIFGSNRLDGMLQKLGLEEGEAIIHPWVNRALEKAQQKIEARNFDIRKQLLRFDDVMNDQRKVVYEQRRDIMEADDISETIEDMRDDLIAELVARFVPEGTYKDNWMLDSLKEECWRIFNLTLPIQEWAEQEGVAGAELIDKIKTEVVSMMKTREEKIGADMMRFVEKNLLLRILDGNWKDHLLSLDHLRQGIHLRAYGQRDPLNEYKAEAFSLFQHLLDGLKEPIIGMLCHFELGEEDSRESISDVLLGDEPDPSELIESRPGLEEEDIPLPAGMTTDKKGQAVSRNSMCPCGSGKRYKHCHGR